MTTYNLTGPGPNIAGGDLDAAIVRYQIGDAVFYRGAWGNQPEAPTTITGIGTKRGQRIYDNALNHWGYADQYSPRQTLKTGG